MRIIQQQPSNHPKLCNLRPGDAVMTLDAATGAEQGPFIIMSAVAYTRLSAVPMMPAGWEEAKKVSVCWKEGTDARIFDPSNGLVYLVHGSTRCRPLRNAAMLVNDNEVA